VLSRYPIIRWENKDISTHALESRGLLHCEIDLVGWRSPLHCVCVHLGLTSRGRRQQLMALRRRIEQMVPADAPLIVAGDFNDWRMHARSFLARPLGLSEVFEITQGGPARSFPSALPLLQLDRIYVRGFRVRRASVHHGRPWSRISDHAALSATVVRI
jgi:endonuclease/exonuclease/phosphatase family metal-dependent hydrolase